jgi:two-component system chemotaxis response regulator CheB
MVTDALAQDPEIEVVGTAMDPYEARDKLKELQPDVLTLDIEMPRMDGLTFLQLLMDRKPMPVIIMSSLTQRGSITALDALRLGAIDILGKPSGAASFGNLGPQLIEKIKAAAIAKVRRIALPPADPAPAPSAPPTGPGSGAPAGSTGTSAPPQRATQQQPSRVVLNIKAVEKPPLPTPSQLTCKDPRALILLGASTGGTEALCDILTKLPNTLPPIAIVQHIPPHFSLAFAQRMNRMCRLEVREAVDGDVLTPGLALIAPGNYHMMVQRAGDRYKVRVVDGPMVWHQRPAVDLLFKSAIESASHVLGGILTGMGKDGAEGLLKLREKGATTFGQDEASCIVYGMPRAAWECGAVQKQVALERIADHIVRTAAGMSASSYS